MFRQAHSRTSLTPQPALIALMMALAMALASLAGPTWASPTSAGAVEPQPSAEQMERKAFIEQAKREQWDAAGEVARKMARSGVSPMLVVTTLTPFGDWDYFYVDGGDIRWTPNRGQAYREVVVPAGFVTDLASIPRVFWRVLRPEGRHAYAAVVHDYLYWTQTRPREEADAIFKLALQDSKVAGETVETLYLAVRNFGQSSWDRNAALRKAGECRFIKQVPSDFTTSWGDWKKQPNVCEAR